VTDRTPLALRRFTLVTVTLPVILVAIAVIVQLVVLPTLPDPVAIHWGASGEPDGYASAWVSIMVTALVGLGIPLLIAVSGRGGLSRGDRGASYRLLGATALGLSTLMSVLGTSTLVMQSGLAAAADAPDIWWALIASVAGGVAAGLVGWFLQPDEPYRATTVAGGDAITLGPTERAVWLQRVQLARSGTIVLGAALLLMVVLTLVSSRLAPDPLAVVVLVSATVLLAILFATTVAFHVRVDDSGLSVISVVGVPRVHIPLAEVAHAEAVEVSPMGEFGGWGLRWAPGGGFGVVLRSGPGIRVTRANGKVFTVTVDDAATGAALLTALRSRPTPTAVRDADG